MLKFNLRGRENKIFSTQIILSSFYESSIHNFSTGYIPFMSIFLQTIFI